MGCLGYHVYSHSPNIFIFSFTLKHSFPFRRRVLTILHGVCLLIEIETVFYGLIF